MDRALKRLKEVVIEPGSEDFNWNVYRSDDDNVDWNLFADSLNSLPLISAHRCVVLKHLGGTLRNKSVTRLIETSVKQPMPDLTLVLIEEAPDFKKSFYKTLQEHCTCVSFQFLKTAELQQYLKDFLDNAGKTIADDALERVLTESDPSLRELLSKLDVLTLYIGDKARIEAEDVENSTVFTREVEIYKLLQALGKRDATEVRITREQLLNRRIDIGTLIYLLFRQIWAMYRMKYLQEKKTPNWKWQEKLNLKPQFLEKRYRGYLSHYTRSELGRSIEILAQADITRKTSSVQDDYILRTLTEKLLRP